MAFSNEQRLAERARRLGRSVREVRELREHATDSNGQPLPFTPPKGGAKSGQPDETANRNETPEDKSAAAEAIAKRLTDQIRVIIDDASISLPDKLTAIRKLLQDTQSATVTQEAFVSRGGVMSARDRIHRRQLYSQVRQAVEEAGGVHLLEAVDKTPLPSADDLKRLQRHNPQLAFLSDGGADAAAARRAATTKFLRTGRSD